MGRAKTLFQAETLVRIIFHYEIFCLNKNFRSDPSA
nr:MAG TPA: hypothetical protein [Inoviridae sp.]